MKFGEPTLENIPRTEVSMQDSLGIKDAKLKNQETIVQDLTKAIDEFVYSKNNLHEHQDVQRMIDSYGAYVRKFREVNDYFALSKDLREKNFDIWENILDDDSGEPGYGHSFKLKEMTLKMLDFNNPEFFEESLSVLTRIEDIYCEFKTDSFDFEDKTKKWPIEEVVEYCASNIHNPNSNALLSLYSESISKHPNYLPYSQRQFDILEKVAPDRFADLSTTVYDHTILISKKGKENEINLERYVENYSKDEERILTNLRMAPFFEMLKPEELFSGKVNPQEAQVLNNLLARIWSNGELRLLIKDNIEIYITDFSIPEQAQIMTFLKTIKNKDLPRIKEFSKNFGNNGFRAFLSLEKGPANMGNKIIMLGEKLPKKETAIILFNKYSEYIDQVDTLEDFVAKTYTKKVPPKKFIEEAKETMLKRGYEILANQANKIEDGSFMEDKFNETMEQAKADVDLFKNLFRIAREHDPESNFSDFSKMSPESTNGKDLSQPDIWTIESIIKKNYREEELQKYVLESFHKAMERNSKINVLRLNNKIIALDRLDENEDGSLYFGSFNVDPDYCSSKIGDAFFQVTIAPHQKEHYILADCPITQPIGAYYVEAGFVGNNYYGIGKESVTPIMKIVNDPSSHYDSKMLSRDEIMKLLDNRTSDIRVFSASTQEELPLDKVNEGKTLTRYFFDKATRLWYVAFE